MTKDYYNKCVEFDKCNELIDKFWDNKEFEKCFEGHLKIAQDTAYPLAECQVGYFYLEGIGVAKDLQQAFYWTERAAVHGDRDGQCNLAYIFENGMGVEVDLEKAKSWYRKAALQNHDIAIDKCKDLKISLP